MEFQLGQEGSLHLGASVSELVLITGAVIIKEEALKMGNYVSPLLQNSPGPGANENSSQHGPAGQRLLGRLWRELGLEHRGLG